MMEIDKLTLKDLQPSQFYISGAKLSQAENWFDPDDLSSFEAIPVKLLDGIPVMTDGHTRATAALRAGLVSVPLVWEQEELDWEMYAKCVEECRRRNVFSPADLLRQVISETDYREKWDRWCDDMQASVLAERAVLYIRELFSENAGGHDAAHTLRVYHNAMLIAETEPGCDREIVSLSALLHDADDYKLFRTENNEHARFFLEKNHVPPEKIERICSAVNSVSFSHNRGRFPETLEGKIVQDADRLDAIGAIGIARTFAYGGEHGRMLKESVQHFYDKLLLLKDMMHTEKAKQLAAERHEFLEAFLKELDEELRCSSKAPVL